MHPSSFLTLLSAILVASAQDRTTEKGEAQIIDPNVECAPYDYAPVDQAVAAGQFPTIWEVASILPNDAAALARYQSIQSQIPNIPPNGVQADSIDGDWSGYNYPSDDPYCWWTYSLCTTPKLAGLPADVTTVPEVRLDCPLVGPAHTPLAEYPGLWF